jgi:membrane fusion protein (multidrug efflux system)
VGAWLTTGTPIVSISEVKRLKAKFALPQRYASALKVGDAVELKDEERDVSKSGKVKALEAALSESSRTRQILVEIDNANGELLAGSFAKVSVSMQSGRVKTIPVPAEALTLDKDGAYVFVATGGKAKIKHVETGLRTPISVDIVSGIDEGDTVISSGLISMREGAAVRIREIRHNTDYELE